MSVFQHQPQGFSALKTAMLVAGLLFLPACTGAPSFLGGSPNRVTSGGPVHMSDTALRALCAGQAKEAVELLMAEPMASPTDIFFSAVALEQAGHPAKARNLYASVMRAGSTALVKIRCGGTTVANGNVMDEAALRLATISRNLALLDVDLRPTRPLHLGLPPSKKSAKSIQSAYRGPRMTVVAPEGQSPFGQWFVHLASYGSIESATKSKSTLSKQFPALNGIIDQWEVNSSGRTAIRLGIRVQGKAAAQKLCTSVKSQGKYCAVINTAS